MILFNHSQVGGHGAAAGAAAVADLGVVLRGSLLLLLLLQAKGPRG